MDRNPSNSHLPAPGVGYRVGFWLKQDLVSRQTVRSWLSGELGEASGFKPGAPAGSQDR